MSAVIGLTGGIATGKSHLSDVLRAEGARVVDADRISRALTAPGGPALLLIRQAFGDGVFDGDILNRRALGARVFADPAELARLNGLLHPMIGQEIRRQLEEASAQGEAVVFLDAPLLYEAGLDKLCGEVWCAWIPRKTQLMRLMARDGLSRREALQRMNSQMSAWEKRRRADRWIDTRGTMEESADQVRRLYRQMLENGGTAPC